MKTMERMKMKIGPWKGPINLNHRNRLQQQKAEEVEAKVTRAHCSVPDSEEDALTLPETPEKAEAEELKETVSVLVHNDKSAMIMQALEVAKEEAAGMEAETMLGDMEITLNSIKPTQMPVKTLPMPMDMDMEASTPSMGEPPQLFNRSPTSQFEFDVMHATHKSYSFALMDEDKSISSEESLPKETAEKSIASEAVSFKDIDRGEVGGLPTLTELVDNVSSAVKMLSGIEDKGVAENDDLVETVDEVLSPVSQFTDYVFCRMESRIPDVVDEVNEFLSNDLHHLIFNCEGRDKVDELSIVEEGEDVEEDVEKEEEGVETALAPCSDKQEGKDEGGVKEGGKEVLVVDGQKGSTDIEAVLGRGEWEELLQARVECASYNPVSGFLLRKDKLPEPARDEVLIRVDATTISTRDYLEKLRRDNNIKFMKDLCWVPGHEIAGYVVSAGTDVFELLGKRIAALLPHGGGCSQYVCIHVKDVIVLPDEADSTEVVALLSSYMAAYQCLDAVAGIQPRAEDDVDSESEGDDVGSLSVADSEVDEDVESKGEYDIESKEGGDIMPKEEGDTELMKEEDVKWEPKTAENTESKEEDLEHMPKKEEDDDVKPKAEENIESKGEEIVGVEDMTSFKDSAGQTESPLFGMKVLVVGAGSPVGLALVELASNAGAFVHTLSDESHMSSIRDMGATRCDVLSNKETWEANWRAEIDLIIDTIGDSYYNPFFYTVLKTCGRLVRLNTTSCQKKYEPLEGVGIWNSKLMNLLKNYKQSVLDDKTVDYNIFNSFEEDKVLFEEDLASLHDLLQVGTIAPKIFSLVGLDELEGEWKKIMAAGGVSGVVVVHPWKVGFTKIV